MDAARKVGSFSYELVVLMGGGCQFFLEMGGGERGGG